jgi:peptide/nickel transport system permease protein
MQLLMSERTIYFIRRTVQSIFILWLISILAFIVIHFAPGGPISVFESPSISPETVYKINKSFGLYDPILIQYFRWFKNIFQGEFGISFVDSRPVLDKITERLPATLELNVTARIIGLLGIPLGLLAAVNKGKLIDRMVQLFITIGSATPHWWIALMILIFFASKTGLLPLGGISTIGKQNNFADRLWHLFLPAIISALYDLIVWSRYIRNQTLDVINQDYVRTAYAKGLKHIRVIFHHVFPNAIIPGLTIIGDLFASFVSGSVVLETVFSWPGIGRLTFFAAIERDYPTVMALLVITSFLIVFGNLFSDALYIWADPRIELR